MKLYHRMTLKAFVEAWESVQGVESAFRLETVELMHRVPMAEIDYSLWLLRRAIQAYESAHAIPEEQSKRDMPFLREGTRMLIGPEQGTFIASFREHPYPDACTVPSVMLELDYKALAEHCLFENLSLLSCKYDKDAFIAFLLPQLEREYDKIFFNAEHTGFKSDSRFFTLLRLVCLEGCEPQKAAEKEWRLVTTCPNEEALYRYEAGDLIPYMHVELPVSCVRRIFLLDQSRQPLLFGTLNGFLKSKGLPVAPLLGLE